MDTSNAKYLEFLNKIAANCSNDCKVYDGYSGRGMYGSECHGIGGPDFVDIIETAASMGLTGARYDSLGRGYIVYWPRPVLSDAVYAEWGEEVDPN